MLRSVVGRGKILSFYRLELLLVLRDASCAGGIAAIGAGAPHAGIEYRASWDRSLFVNCKPSYSASPK